MTDERQILETVRTIAIVGLSPNPDRDSNIVANFLKRHGYDCIGVNPGQAGKQIQGIPVVATLADIDRPVDMVDIFRASDAAGGVVDETLVMSPHPRVIWMQLGVVDHAAKARAEAAGLTVVMDRCPKIVLGG